MTELPDTLPEDRQHSINLLAQFAADERQCSTFADRETVANEAARDSEYACWRIGALAQTLMAEARADALLRKSRGDVTLDNKPITDTDVDAMIRNAVNTLAKAINVGKTFVYDHASMIEFYGRTTVAHYHGERHATPGHLKAVMRGFRKKYPVDEYPELQERLPDMAVGYIENCVIPQKMSSDESRFNIDKDLAITHVKPIHFTGKLTDIIDGQLVFRVDSYPDTLQMGVLYTFSLKTNSARAEKDE